MWFVFRTKESSAAPAALCASLPVLSWVSAGHVGLGQRRCGPCLLTGDCRVAGSGSVTFTTTLSLLCLSLFLPIPVQGGLWASAEGRGGTGR